jgi:hypothetical protein
MFTKLVQKFSNIYGFEFSLWVSEESTSIPYPKPDESSEVKFENVLNVTQSKNYQRKSENTFNYGRKCNLSCLHKTEHYCIALTTFFAMSQSAISFIWWRFILYVHILMLLQASDLCKPINGLKLRYSKGFWRWCVTLGITGYLGSVHRPVF